MARAVAAAVVLATSLAAQVPAAALGVSLAAGIPDVAAGAHHTCALANDGSVWCWGTDAFGQLGDGSAQLAPRTDGRRVVGISRATAVVAGIDHSCALLANGTAACWGRNQAHQLGDRTNRAFSATPVSVFGLDHAVALTSRDNHTCARIDDGTVSCWGDDAAGGLLPGIIGPRGAVHVDGLANVAQVTAGPLNDCAVLDDATLKCWGGNKYGQLGDGSTTPSAVPVTVQGLGSVRAVAPGVVFTCALQTDGTAWCWGKNKDKSLGRDGDTVLASLVPLQISAVSDAVAIAAGAPVCVLNADESMLCWGQGNSGEMGQGPNQHSDRSHPVQPLGIDSAHGFDVGGEHVCAALDDATIKCWGAYDDGAVGVDKPFDILAPETAAAFDAGPVALGNDSADSPQFVIALPFSDAVDPPAATTSEGDPDPSCGPDGLTASAWYRYVSDYDRALRLSTTSDGTSAAAYVDDGNGLVEIGCATSAADAALAVTAGRPLVIVLAGDGSGAPMTLTLEAAADAPNDDFADATPITTLPESHSTDTSTATLEQNEPKPSCAPETPPFNSVWYSFEPVTQVSVALLATGYPSRIGVYTGTVLDDLDEVACLGGANDRFTAEPGTTYRIQVFGLNGSGDLDLSAAEAAAIDATPPVIDSLPIPAPMADTVLGQAQTRIDWTAHDDASGIDHYELQRRNGTGQWVTVASPTTNQAVLPEKIGVAHTFRVRAYDVAGNVGAWSTGVSYTPTLKQATWSKITYAGTWVTDSISGASGSGVRRTLKKDATATFSFAGRALQIIVVKGPGRSVARIAVDGIGTNVDLSAGSVTLQWIGFARSWSGAGTHTVQIKNTSNARLELDALVIYQ